MPPVGLRELTEAVSSSLKWWEGGPKTGRDGRLRPLYTKVSVIWEVEMTNGRIVAHKTDERLDVGTHVLHPLTL